MKKKRTNIDKKLFKVISFLKRLNKYQDITDKIEYVEPNESPEIPPPLTYCFEALFAYNLERLGMSQKCNDKINPENDKDVDFTYKLEKNGMLCFELLRPDKSEKRKEASPPQKTEINGITFFEENLNSKNPEPHLKPEAQTIILQEKILEKVDKFPIPHNNLFSIIVVDCSNFHGGNFDEGDCAMVMYGKTTNPLHQEYWEGKRIDGLLLDAHKKRNARKFRERISAIVFLPKLTIDFSGKCFLAFNTRRAIEHQKTLYQELIDCNFKKIILGAILFPS